MNVLDLNEIKKALSIEPSEAEFARVLSVARKKKGLSVYESAILLNASQRDLLDELFKVASEVKKEIYGDRLVFFAPLYISDFCMNDCEYCNFHRRNLNFNRKKLTLREIAAQTEILIDMGHKRLLLECGESPQNNIDYIVDAMRTIYSIKTQKGNIRRINVNIAPTSVENYKKLKSAGIGTYQLFQETYHEETYRKLHKGPKANYYRQLYAHDKAFEAGIDDVGLGVLFGLYDWRFEVLALISHAYYLDKKYGAGPHTISVPRFRPAPTVDYSPEYKVDDSDFLKLIAVLRLAIPYTGLILSTRESPEIRRKAFQIGISQASAASVTVVGGYGTHRSVPQFETADHRPLCSVIEDVISLGLLPSFCTSCYRVGRTGERFMGLAKPGQIHKFCLPNALLSFAEYLEDFTSGKVYKKGYEVIERHLEEIKNKSLIGNIRSYLDEIKHGKRDVYI